MVDYENMLKPRGRLWQELSEKGHIYFSMEIGDKQYLILQNPYRESDSEPDFLVYEKQITNDKELADEYEIQPADAEKEGCAE